VGTTKCCATLTVWLPILYVLKTVVQAELLQEAGAKFCHILPHICHVLSHVSSVLPLFSFDFPTLAARVHKQTAFAARVHKQTVFATRMHKQTAFAARVHKQTAFAARVNKQTAFAARVHKQTARRPSQFLATTRPQRAAAGTRTTATADVQLKCDAGSRRVGAARCRLSPSR
jgi:hypothetical protein